MSNTEHQQAPGRAVWGRAQTEALGADTLQYSELPQPLQETTRGDGDPGAKQCHLREPGTVTLSFELSVLSLACPVLVPEIKEVVSHKYKTPMVSVPPGPDMPGLLGDLNPGGGWVLQVLETVEAAGTCIPSPLSLGASLRGCIPYREGRSWRPGTASSQEDPGVLAGPTCAHFSPSRPTRSATPCCVSSHMWPPRTAARKVSEPHLGLSPADRGATAASPGDTATPCCVRVHSAPISTKTWAVV